MTPKKVLICYSSSYGYVADISYEIKKILEEKGLVTHLVDLRKTRRNQWPLLNEYNAILTGSSAGDVSVIGVRFQGSTLRKELRTFFNLNLDEIIRNNKILGVFKSDPFELEAIITPEEATEILEQKLINKYGFKPSICTQFGPVVDLSRKSKLKADPKKTLRSTVKVLMKKTGLEFDMKGFNDFRDWERIREFAIKIADMLKNPTNSSEVGNTCPNCGINVDPKWNFCTNCNHKLH